MSLSANALRAAAEASWPTPGVEVATAYYSDDPDEHRQITGRPAHPRTRANIIKAIGLGIPLRVGIVKVLDGQRVEQARAELEALGVTRIDVDHVRPSGRGADSGARNPSNLCGERGTGRPAVSPDGTATPCAFANWMNAGNVRDGLGTAVPGERTSAANALTRDSIRAAALQARPDEDRASSAT